MLPLFTLFCFNSVSVQNKVASRHSYNVSECSVPTRPLHPRSLFVLLTPHHHRWFPPTFRSHVSHYPSPNFPHLAQKRERGEYASSSLCSALPASSLSKERQYVHSCTANPAKATGAKANLSLAVPSESGRM